MSDDGPREGRTILTRNAARTRQALLSAAASAIVAHGSGVSLDVVAREAGVSKGGLLHHFRTREALLLALVDEWLARFESSVQRYLDPADDRPGRLARAHVRATFDDQPGPEDEVWRQPAMVAALVSVPEVLQRARESGRRWHEQMSGDGLHADRVVLIRGCIDGVLMSEMFEGPTSEQRRRRTRDLLLGLSEGTGPLLP
jgi:AcrR family transcriptional regulator